MRRIKALSLTQSIKEWQANTNQSRILHVFNAACNLINEHGDILSIVTPKIGNGPFNLVVEENALFAEYLDAESEIAIHEEQIILSDLSIVTASAQLWNPSPDWEVLYAAREEVVGKLMNLLPIIHHQPSLPDSLLSTLASSIISADVDSALTAARQLAGLGIGLTPAGDDFIMGAIYSAWIIHSPEVARGLVKEIAKKAAPLTTSLSAAWLRSAGKGEAGEVWHHLLDALVLGDKLRIQESIDSILAVGETSGADALAGFVGVCAAYKERIIE